MTWPSQNEALVQVNARWEHIVLLLDTSCECFIGGVFFCCVMIQIVHLFQVNMSYIYRSNWVGLAISVFNSEALLTLSRLKTRLLARPARGWQHTVFI